MSELSVSPPAKTSRKRAIIIWLSGITAVIIVIGGIYIVHERQYIFTDKAEIEAPLIALGPQKPGALKRVYVHEGDIVHASQTLALVGDETINAETDGLIVDANGNIGAFYQPGQAVLMMIEPKELHIVARIDEDKGLKDIYAGQKVYFTLDAYGSREFTGRVASVSPTKRADDVVFNISDKRETKQFDVDIRYMDSDSVRFQNGMSARVWIVK